MEQPILHVKQVRKNFGANEVLNGIDLTINQGEIFGFVGRNGAGKSTFIHLISGIMHKSAGDVQLFGVDIEHIDDVKHRIGVMPDVANLYEHMRGIDFLYYMGKLIGDPRSKKEYEDLFVSVGLEGAAYKKIKSYSFGMRKKISIAQALLGNPDFIILDEPTSGLDPESAIKIREMVVKLNEQGKTIFLTSHNLDEIDKVSDRVGILSEGVIKRIGHPEQLKTNMEETQMISIRTMPALQQSCVENLSELLQIDMQFMKEQHQYTVLTIPKEDDIPTLIHELVQAGTYVYEVKIEQQSLEEVFMNV